MPSAFISSGVSLAPASAAGGADEPPPENSRMATNSTSRATGIINHFRSPLLRMAGLLVVGGLGFGLRQMHGWVEAVDRRQQRLREAVPRVTKYRTVVSSGVPRGPSASCWKVAVRKSPCNTRGSG